MSEITFCSVSRHDFSRAVWICVKDPLKSAHEGTKTNSSTVNKLWSKYSAVFVSTFPLTVPASETSRSLVAADLYSLWLCHKFRPTPASFLSSLLPDTHNNSGVEVWRGNRRAPDGQRGKKRRYWQPHITADLCQTFSDWVHVLLVLLKSRATVTVLCPTCWRRAAANQRHPAEKQNSPLRVCIYFRSPFWASEGRNRGFWRFLQEKLRLGESSLKGPFWCSFLGNGAVQKMTHMVLDTSGSHDRLHEAHLVLLAFTNSLNDLHHRPIQSPVIQRRASAAVDLQFKDALTLMQWIIHASTCELQCFGCIMCLHSS